MHVFSSSPYKRKVELLGHSVGAIVGTTVDGPYPTSITSLGADAEGADVEPESSLFKRINGSSVLLFLAKGVKNGG